MAIVCRCGRCNRTLSDPESIKLGYGPVCYVKKYGTELQKEKSERRLSHKKIKQEIDLSEYYNLDEVFKDVC